MFDVVVAGLGGMGSAAAYHLARRGLRVIGFDPYVPPHEYGSSHGKSRIIRQAYFEDPSYVPLVLRAYELWEQLERDSGRELLVRTGGLMIGPPDSGIVEGSARSAREHGLPYRMLSPDDVARWFPAFRLEPDEVAVYEDDAGVLFPEECILAHLELAARHGAELRTGERVVAWSVDDAAGAGGGGVTVRTDIGEYRAQNLILAAGPWLTDLARASLTLEVERQVNVWLRPAERPEIFDGGHMPVFVWHFDAVESFYGIPGLQGEGVKVGFHYGGVTGRPDQIPRDVGPEEVERIRRLVRLRLPLLDGEHLDSRVCLYTNTPDRHFAIGRHPEAPAVLLAGGFSGHGFKFSAVVGEIVADFVTEGATNMPVERFNPARLRR